MTEEVQGQNTEGVDIDALTSAAEAAADPVNPIEDLARDAGWKPKDEWRGNPDDWREPQDFIKYGMKRSRESADELRSLRTQVGAIGKTSEALMRRHLEDQRRELETQFAGAVENKDHEGARVAREGLNRLDAEVTAPPPTAQAWVERNSWFTSDPEAAAVARATTARLANEGKSVEEQLSAAEEAVKKRFPEHFGERPPAKVPASVSAPTTRTANATARAKGFTDLPAEAQKAGHDFVKRGMVKTLDDYAKVYLEENA